MKEFILEYIKKHKMSINSVYDVDGNKILLKDMIDDVDYFISKYSIHNEATRKSFKDAIGYSETISVDRIEATEALSTISSDIKELEDLTKQELVDIADDEYDLTLNVRSTKDKIIEELIRATQGE